jgi:hypothetical protein
MFASVSMNGLVHVLIGKGLINLNGARWMQAVPIAHLVSQEVHEGLWYDLFLPGKNMSALLVLEQNSIIMK